MQLSPPQVAAGFYIGELLSKDAERGVRLLLRLRDAVSNAHPVYRIHARGADTAIGKRRL